MPRQNVAAVRPHQSIRRTRWQAPRRRHKPRIARRRADRTALSRASAASGAGYSNSTVRRPCPRCGSTCSTSTLLKISDQVSSSAIRTRPLRRSPSARDRPRHSRSSPADRFRQSARKRPQPSEFPARQKDRSPAAKRKPSDAGRLRRMRDHDDAVGHDGVIAGIRRGTIPAW